MKVQVIYKEGNYYVAVKGMKIKSRTFYYHHVGYIGAVFVLSNKIAHTCHTEEEATSLAKYLMARIKEVGLALKLTV